MVLSCDEELLAAVIALLTDDSDIACAAEEVASLDGTVPPVFCWLLQAARLSVKRSIVTIESGLCVVFIR
jgi:UDP-3-O-acyl-N-acetylglucosamine deacetylase